MTNKTEPVEILSPQAAQSFANRDYLEAACQDHFWVKQRFRTFLKVVDALALSKEATLRGLDIGCGNGVTADQIEAVTAWTVDRTDLDLDMLMHLKKGRGQVFLYDILERLPSMREQYDFLLLFDVIEHIDDVGLFVAACLEHVKKGGFLFINVPAMKALTSSYDTLQGHRRRYSAELLHQELENLPLDILEMRYWGILMIPLLWIRRIISGIKESGTNICKAGFEPSHILLHNVLRFMMDIENKFFNKPWRGTSLMAVVQKK